MRKLGKTAEDVAIKNEAIEQRNLLISQQQLELMRSIAQGQHNNLPRFLKPKKSDFGEGLYEFNVLGTDEEAFQKAVAATREDIKVFDATSEFLTAEGVEACEKLPPKSLLEESIAVFENLFVRAYAYYT